MDKSVNLRNEMLDEGVIIFDNENISNWTELRDSIKSKVGVDSLSEIHKNITSKQINEKRLAAFRALNEIENWEDKYFSMGESFIKELLGPDLLIQRKLNLSIQMPFDTTSTLSMHADTLSGQSPFEVVMWTAFSEFQKEAGMYYFDRTVSKDIFSEMLETEKKGLDFLREKYWSKRKYLEIKENQVAVFSGTIFHGNVVNETENTRVSINCRFKNLYSPEGSELLNERGVGIFYKLLKISPVTQIAADYHTGDLKF